MPWKDITVSDEFRSMSPVDRSALKQRFFETKMLPRMRGDNLQSEEIDSLYQRFMETPDDTGEGLIRSALGSAARGFLDPLAAAPEVAGAYLGIEGLEEFGGDVRGAIEGAFPVNPAEQGFVTDAFGVLGQVGQIVATGGGGAVAGAKLLGKGATEAAKRQAMRFGATAAQQTAMGSSAVAGGLERAEQLGLEGGDRLLRGAIAGGTELLAERLGGFATELGGVGKAAGFADTVESGFMKPIIRGIGTEAGEEGLAEAAGQATDIAMAPEAAPGMDLKNIGYAMLLGGVGGAAFGGIEAAITPRTKKAFDGTTDFIPSSEPPPGMTAEEAEEQDLLRYGNAGEIVGYVLPKKKGDTIEGDLPLTIDSNIEPLVDNVTKTPEASATASALRRIVVDDAESGLSDLGEVDTDANLLTGIPMQKPLGGELVVDEAMLEGQLIEDVPLTQETLQQEQGSGQELQESRELPILPSEPAAQAPEAAVGAETAELEQKAIPDWISESASAAIETIPVDKQNAIKGLAADGKTAREIAAQLQLSEQDVIAARIALGIPPRTNATTKGGKDVESEEFKAWRNSYLAEQQKATLPVDGGGAMLQGRDVRQEETQQVSLEQSNAVPTESLPAGQLTPRGVGKQGGQIVSEGGQTVSEGKVSSPETLTIDDYIRSRVDEGEYAEEYRDDPEGAKAARQQAKSDYGRMIESHLLSGGRISVEVADGIYNAFGEEEANLMLRGALANRQVGSGEYAPPFARDSTLTYRQYLAKLNADGMAFKNSKADYRAMMERSAKNQFPLSFKGVRDAGITLPQGYTLNEAGDLYVFNATPPPQAQPQPATPATQETKPQAAALATQPATQESTAAQPAAGETGDAGVAISPTGETVQSSETPSALSKLQSYISTLSPKDQQLWTPERLAAAEAFYNTGNRALLDIMPRSLRNRVYENNATESDKDAYEAEQKRQFALRNPPAATDSQFLDDYNAYVNSLSDETLQKERESREEAPGVGDARYSKQFESLDKKHAELEKLAKAGDKAAAAEAERMVAEAARNVKFTESLMHGSPVSETTVFRTPLYLTDSTRTARDYARSRSGDGRIYNVFLNKGKELNLFDYKHWPELVSTLDARGSDTTALKKAIVDTLYPEQFGDGNDRTWENYSSNIQKLESQGVEFFWDIDGNELSSTLNPERGFAALDQSSRVDALFDLGFDTLIQPEGGYSIEDGAAWIVKSPPQIKSSDPFTYSDDGKLVPLSQRFQPDSPDIRYKKILRSADGSIRRTGVKSTPARAARNSYIGVIPGVENTWLGTTEDFDAEFPDGYPFDSKTTTPPADTEALVAEDGRAFIFIDRVQVLDGDAERAEQHGTSPGVEAIKRLLRHESFVHRGFMSLPGPLKARFADFVASGVIPEAELDYLVNNGYPQYKGWRDNKTTEMLAAEEWLAQRVERMGRIPQSGPIASIMDWLRDVWRWLTGGETTDLDKLRNTMRAMHKALGALDPKQRIVMELPDMDVLRRSVAQTQQDQEYLAAVERGDMETAQRMVNEAAKDAGFDTGPVLHSSESGFDVFNDKVQYFSSDPTYPRLLNGVVRPFYLKIENSKSVKLEDIEGLNLPGVNDAANAMSDGFDAFVYQPPKDVDKFSYERHPQIAVFNPNQIKSADPVTYDSNGAPIPLSQRFQSTSSDIRYSKVQRPDPILNQPSRLRGNVPEMTKPNAQRRAIYETVEGFEGAVEVIPRQYFPMGSKEKGNEFSATDALLSWSKDLLKPYAEDIGGLIEFLAILRSDERLQNELKLGPRSGAVVMPFLAQEAANRAEALGSRDMRNAFLMEYDALASAGGQNLWAFKAASLHPDFATNRYTAMMDKTEEQNFAATVDKKINKSRTIQDVVSNLPEAGEVAADNVSDGLAEEEMIRLSVLELGVLAQDDPELRDLLEELIATTLDLGEMSGTPERASIAARRVKREFASEEEKAVVFEQLKSRQTEILQTIQDKLKAKKADTAKTPAKEKASKPIETAKEIINKITTAAAKVPAKKKQPDAVRSLYRKHLKKPMSEAEFSAEAKAAGLDAATTKGLYDAINLEIVAIEIQAQAKAAERAQTKELKKAEREAEKYQNQAEAKINEVADALADPSLTQDKEKVVNPLTEIYQNQIKTPIAEAQFVEQVVALGVDEETATLLFSIAAMDRQARIDIRVAREDLRRREMSEAQASKLIYAQEEELRQGSKDREPSKSGDSINKAFREQVVNPLSQEKFRERLDKLKVSQKLADRLYATAERVATDNERAEVYRKRVALLDVDSAALTRFVNDLRLKGKLTGEPIQWRDLLSLPVAHQDTVKAELLARVKRHEALRNLSTGEQQAIADALNTIWQRERRKVFQAMIKKADLMGVSKEDQEVIVDAMPALLKYINQGMLGTSAFYRAVGEKFGIAPISAEARKQVEEMAAKMQEKEMYSFERAVLAEKILKILQNNTQLSRAEILSSFWVTSVLSGGRTIFDMALGVLNGGFSIAKKMITATIETRSPKAAIEGLTAFGQGIWMGAQVAAKNLIRPEEGLLASRNPAVADYFDDGARGAGLTTGDKLLLHKGDKPKDKLRRGLGVWMSFFERLFSGLDHINSTATMMGTMRMAAAINPKLYNAALIPTKKDYDNAFERAKQRLPNGSKAAQIALSQSIINDGQHILERGLDESFMNQWRQLVADSRAEGNTASYQEEPTGAGGLLYKMVRNTTSGIEEKTRGYRDDARVSLAEARKTGRGLVTSSVNYFVTSLGYFLGTQAQNLFGVRFMRFTGNKLNELISFIPVVGMARIQEKGMVSGEEYTLRGKNVIANQVLGYMSAFLYFTLLNDLDEEDDEERGWIVNGSWENLTPERKSQLMSDGFKPNTVAFFDKGTGRWTSYNFVSWPFAGWMAAFGSVSDYKRLTPDKWNEKILIDKTMAAAYAGAFAITDISSLSSLTEMFGRSTYTTDPAEAAQKRVIKGASNFLGGFIPKTFKDIDSWFDETNYKPEESWEHFAKEMPFYRRSVGAPLRDIFYEPVQVSRTPWSRALQVSPDDPAYKALGRLNSRGIWLTPANPENRKVKRGGKLRDMTDEESNAYMAEVGKRYKEFVMKQGDRLLEMDVDRADELVSKYTARIREIAFKKAIASSAKSAIP